MEFSQNHTLISATTAAIFDNGRQASIYCSVVVVLTPTAPCIEGIVKGASRARREEAEVRNITVEDGDARRGEEEVVAEERREAESG